MTPLTDPFQLLWTPFLQRRSAETLQAVGLRFPTGLGSGGQVTLRVDARTHEAGMMDLIRCPPSSAGQEESADYLWLIPRPRRPVKCRAEWKTPLGRIHRAELLLTPAEPTDVHVVLKTHLDLGYTHPLREVIRLYRSEHLKRLLENLDATAHRPAGRRYVWTMPAWLVEQCLDARQVAARERRRFEHHIRQGNVVWGLTPFTAHSEFFGLEEMCRSLYLARRLAERFGRPAPTAAKLTDVPAHTASLGMALAAAGGTFLQIGTNPNSRPPAVPPLFWWKLPDRSRMLVHYHGTYGTPLLPPESWPYRDWLAVLVTGDNQAPVDLSVIEHLDWMARHFDFPRCRIGRLEDFAGALIRRHGAALPVLDKEVTDWWIYGIASQARPTALARRAKDRLASAEALLALTEWSGPASAAAVGIRSPLALTRAGRAARATLRSAPGALDRAREDGPPQRADRLNVSATAAFEQLALYTEHTWGDHASDARQAQPAGNLYTSRVLASDQAAAPVDRWVASWSDKAPFAERAHEQVNELESQARALLARPRFGKGGEAARPALVKGGLPGRSGSTAGPAVVLFNTLSWPRGGVVRLESRSLPCGELELIDASTGGAVAYERGAEGIEFIAPPVPACGYLCLEVRPAAQRSRPGQQADWSARDLALHSSENTLQFHTRGGLSRWHDRRHSVQWCSGAAEFPTGAYLYEMPGGARMREFARQVHSNVLANTEGFFHRPDYAAMAPFGPLPGGPARVEPQITPLFSRILVEAEIPPRSPPGRRSGDAQRYRLTYTLYRGRPELYVNLALFDKAPTYAAEAGYAFFPFAVDAPHVLVDRIAHLATPAEDLAGGVNAAHMAVHHGVRVEGDHAGMNFYPLDSPLISFGAPGAYHYSEKGAFTDGTIYATLFNNCWGTNFAQWQSGDFSFDFVLHPTGNDGWDGGLSRGGMEYARPLIAAVTAGRPAAPALSLLKIDPPAVQLVALKPAEFTAGYCLRLWNALLDPAVATLSLPAARRGDSLWICDLLERPVRGLRIGPDGQARVPLRPHQIATLLLRPREISRQRTHRVGIGR